MEGDAKIVIDVVNSRRQDESSKGHLIADILLGLSSFPSWEMIYVRKEGNKVAHRLATFAVHEYVNRVWLTNLPECIRDPLQADIYAVLSMNYYKAIAPFSHQKKKKRKEERIFIPNNYLNFQLKLDRLKLV